MTQFRVRTESFEGPLDLLLSLIEKRKLLVNDFSLAEIADDFISHAQSIADASLRETADFIVIASTLMLIKSRSLLPGLALTEEEEGNMEDLQNRLRIYSRVKELSFRVREMFGQKRIFPRGETKEIKPVFSPSRDIARNSLFLAAQSVIAALPKQESTPKAQVKKMVTLEEVMSRLIDRIRTHIKMSFKEFAGREKSSVVVTFLALLELVKRGAVAATQDGHGEDIEIETREVAVPRY